MTLPADWEQRLDRLYDAAGDRQMLGEALATFFPLPEVQRAGIITTPDVLRIGSLVVASYGVSDEEHVSCQVHFGAEDEWVKGAVARGAPRPGDHFLGSELVEAGQLLRSHFWCNYCVPYRSFDVVGCVLRRRRSG